VFFIEVLKIIIVDFFQVESKLFRYLSCWMGMASSSSAQMKTYPLRRASHAGSWYKSSCEGLDADLIEYLEKAASDVTISRTSNGENHGCRPLDNDVTIRGIVGPHAGYSYSGPTAAYAYQVWRESWKRQIETGQRQVHDVDTILVLHPSHYVFLDGCALSSACELETPLGNLLVASELRQSLWDTNQFSIMDQETDEREHSGEMHYPLIAKILSDLGVLEQVRILPIMVGSINPEKEEYFGSILAKFIAKQNIMTIVSSDFCHWGARFDYQPMPQSNTLKIFEHISELDHQGMKIIELQEPGAFATYIRTTRNTVCGRHPLGVWLNAISQNKQSGSEALDVTFIRYAQSSKVQSIQDSSVSYASAIATLM
jgi:MEMO1 family protein